MFRRFGVLYTFRNYSSFKNLVAVFDLVFVEVLLYSCSRLKCFLGERNTLICACSFVFFGGLYLLLKGALWFCLSCIVVLS